MNQTDDWGRHISELAPGLYRYFCARFEPQLSEDLVQETIFRLVTKVRGRQFDSTKGSLRMYAYGIAHFVRLEALRAPQFEEIPHQHADGSDEDQWNRRLDRQRLRQAIATLSDIQQQVIGLYLDDELSLEEIARLLEIPLGTIKSHIHRAKETLRAALHSQQEAKS